MDKKLQTLPEPIRADTRAAIQTAKQQRNAVQQYLANKLEAMLKTSPAEVDALLTQADRDQLKALDREMAARNSQRRTWGLIQAVYDVGPPAPTHLLKRGEHEQPGIEVPPGCPEILGEISQTATALSGPTSGRRLALAKALTDPQTAAGALVARVQVNRIWLHLFGRGLVETPDNLGRSGPKPSHPELLEWLTARFLHDDRRFKSLIRLLVTSSVYRQASVRTDAAGASQSHAADPDNLLLWKARLRRVESEVVRDVLLTVSGRLDRTMSGPPIPLEVLPDGMVIIKRQGLTSATSHWRRSVYLLARRSYHPTLLDVFDQPLLPSNCVCRKPSSVVTQSLAMLNDSFVQECAAEVARRVAQAAGPVENQVEQAFRTVLARPPRDREAIWSVELLQRQAERYRSTGLPPEQATARALTHLCHMLLNTSEFLYIP